ncbi:arrestin domain-containing protein 4-like [Glandiceps talaboti]
MGIIKKFAIRFDEDKVVYQLGDVVSGHVLLHLNENIKCKAVYMRFRGKAYTEWMDQAIPIRLGFSNLVKHYNEKCVLEERVNMWGKGKGSEHNDTEQKYLVAGEHKFPFQLRLPPNDLPCSFEGDYGYVRYFASCVLQRPRATDIDTRNGFTILGLPVDLNTITDVQVPMETELVKQVSCCFVRSGRVAMTASINRRGYTPGDRIAINLDLENNTNRKVTCVKATLVQEVMYQAKRGGSGRTKKRRTVQTAKGLNSPGCKANERLRWNGKTLTVPPVPPTGLEGCPFIDIQYFVKLRALVKGESRSLDVSFSVVVGTVPITRLVQQSTQSDLSLSLEDDVDDIQNIVPALPPPYTEHSENDTTHEQYLPPIPSYDDLFSSSGSLSFGAPLGKSSLGLG